MFRIVTLPTRTSTLLLSNELVTTNMKLNVLKTSNTYPFNITTRVVKMTTNNATVAKTSEKVTKTATNMCAMTKTIRVNLLHNELNMATVNKLVTMNEVKVNAANMIAFFELKVKNIHHIRHCLTKSILLKP
jgi:hypothetical protein